ncbi:MAG: hypothetical protein ACK4N4_08820 [Burkholderiales bacterium]
MRKAIAAAMVSLAMAMPLHAQIQRPLPANGKLGQLGGQLHPLPLVEIDREVLRLAPGGVIMDRNNRTIVHGHLPPHAEVLYVLDPRGEISRIIILTPEELARLEQTAQR